MKSFKRSLANFCLFFILLVMAVGCNPAQATPTAISPSSTALPTEAMVATASTPETVEVLDLATPTPENYSLVEKKYLTVEDGIPANLSLTGVWIRNRSRPYLNNIENQIDYGIPLYGGSVLSPYDMAVSPDGKWLAYTDTYLDTSTHKANSKILRVINSAGHSLDMDYWRVDWQSIIGWIDNKHLALIIHGSKTEIVSLNPFKGKWEKIPGLDDYMTDSYWYPIAFNVKLDKVVMKADNKVVLKDVMTGKVLWQSASDNEIVVTWNQDGSTLAVVSSQILYIIDSNQEIANFDLKKLDILETKYMIIHDLIWSPDGKKILITTYNKLLVLDTTLPKITDFCFSDTKMDYGWYTPVWSPDSRFIITYISHWSPPYWHSETLLDIDQGYAYKLPTPRYDQDRIGWLAKP